MRLSLRTKILLAMLSVALLVASATAGTLYVVRRGQLVEELQMFVRGVAGTAALALRGDELGLIRRMDDRGRAEFATARGVLDRVREINHLRQEEVYVMRPTRADLAEMEFVVMLQGDTFIGDRYAIAPANRPLVQAAWATREPQATEVYVDEHGTWISGYAAVLDGAGKPVAIIETDAEISRLLAGQRRALALACASAGGALAVGVLPGLWLAGSITRGLSRLASGIRRFQSGDHAVRVEVSGGDEVARLAGVFNEMIASLSERLALLPYVSRFTAEAVRRSREDPRWLTGSQQEVVVLFADLRGFTRFCEERGATQLVRELNGLLAVQAEAVISAGGDVDKFVGDCVMAVFLDGDGSGTLAAMACAEELVRKVAEQTREHSYDLTLGVGLHRGEAVVGSIGSQSRRDFTAIGHTVNLASRLCDRARPWEILVSDKFFEALPAERRANFVKHAPARLKNVSSEVTMYGWIAGEAGVPVGGGAC